MAIGHVGHSLATFGHNVLGFFTTAAAGVAAMFVVVLLSEDAITPEGFSDGEGALVIGLVAFGLFCLILAGMSAVRLGNVARKRSNITLLEIPLWYAAVAMVVGVIVLVIQAQNVGFALLVAAAGFLATFVILTAGRPPKPSRG